MKIRRYLFIILTLLATNATSLAQPKGKIDSLNNVLKGTIADTTRINTLISLSTLMRESGEFVDSKNYAISGLTLSKKIKFRIGEANSLNNIAIINILESNYTEGMKNIESALKIFTETGYLKGVAQSYNNMATIYKRQGILPEAIKYFLASLKIFEEIGNKKGMAGAYNNIGAVYDDLDNYTEALKNYAFSLKIKIEIGDKQGIAANHNNIATVYEKQGKIAMALENLKIALKMQREIGNKHAIANACSNIGVLYTDINKYDEAAKYINEALMLQKEIGDKKGMAGTLNDLGGLYLTLKEYTLGRKYTYEALAISREIKSKDDILNSLSGIILLDSVSGDWKSAYEHHKLLVLYRDSLAGEEDTKKILAFQMQYEFDRKEAAAKAESDKKELVAQAEIKRQTLIRNSTFGGVGIIGIFSFLVIRLDNRRRKTSFEKQVSEVEMTALRSQMNPHFIFNSLHSINNYMMNNDKRNASDYLGKFSKLMRLILENSREQEVPLEKDLLTLELYMELEAMRFENKFSYKIEVADDLDPENLLVPPMILQPFVENSILHGLQHKVSDGRILIKIQKENDMLVCVVEDNGVGRQKAMEMKETTATHKGESLGMKITNARIDIINKLKKAKASVRLVDLSEGMRAEVKLPLELAF